MINRLMGAHIEAEKEKVLISPIIRRPTLFVTVWDKFHFIQTKFVKKNSKKCSLRYLIITFLEKDNRALEQVPESVETDASNELCSEAL